VLVDGEPDVRLALRLRPLLLPQRQGAARARLRPLLLPAQDGEPPRGAALERRLRPRAGGARPPGAPIKATVLIETILAAFEMDEILYELRDHSPASTAAAGTTSSASSRSSGPTPASSPTAPQVTMTRRSFMRLFEAAHQDLPPPRRHAMGGMAAQIPIKERPGRQRGRARQGARRQGARGKRRPRRHLGRAPGLRAARLIDEVVSATALEGFITERAYSELEEPKGSEGWTGTDRGRLENLRPAGRGSSARTVPRTWNGFEVRSGSSTRWPDWGRSDCGASFGASRTSPPSGR
jgi:hypothetical protein